MKIAKTLVVTDRIEERIQPEIYYSFKTAARNIKSDKKIAFKFYSFNPYIFSMEPPFEFAKSKKRVMELLNDVVDDVINLKKQIPADILLFNAVMAYIRKNETSRLSELYTEITKVLNDFVFLIIESTAKTVVHPMFYEPSLVTAEYGRAVKDDIKDTLYGLMFIEAAFEQNKPVFGTCHGAQLGYLHAGGGLTQVFDKKEPEAKAYYARKNPHKGPEELWQIDIELNTRKRQDLSVYSTLKYPLPVLFKKPNETGENNKFINKDFRHTLAMTEPIPNNIEVLSFHPLSFESGMTDKYEINQHPDIEKPQLEKFKSALKQMPIVDAFKYKTLLGFQYHPHYTYDDFNTSEIFDYLIENIAAGVHKCPKGD